MEKNFPSPNLGLSLKSMGVIDLLLSLITFRPLIWGYL